MEEPEKAESSKECLPRPGIPCKGCSLPAILRVGCRSTKVDGPILVVEKGKLVAVNALGELAPLMGDTGQEAA